MDYEDSQRVEFDKWGRKTVDLHEGPHCHKRKSMVLQELSNTQRGFLSFPVWWLVRCRQCQQVVPFTCSHSSCILQQLQFPTLRWAPNETRRAFPCDPHLCVAMCAAPQTL
eukprot:EG_transcript_22518